MGSHQDLLLRYRLTDFYKMVSLKVVMGFAIMSSTVAIFVFRPPSKECRSDRDCQTFRRTSSRRQSYLLPGKCNKVPDTWCHIGNFFGKRNRCNAGSRCAKCLGNQDCPSLEECSNYSCRLIPGKCRVHAHCTGSQKCTNDGQCIIPHKDWCDSDFNCSGFKKCSNNVCVDSCRYDRDCGVSQKCLNDI